MVHIAVIGGPMSAGKTTELSRRYQVAKIAHQHVVIIKPTTDDRSGASLGIRQENPQGEFVIVEKDPATLIQNQEELQKLLQEFEPELLIVDEAHFFKEWFCAYMRELSLRKDLDMRIVIAGLELDAWGNTFGFMPQLMAIADEVIKLTAVCMKCRKEGATMTQKKGGSHEQIEVGSKMYEARCKRCWTPPEN